MTAIRISDRMAEALTDAARTEDGHEIRVGTRVGTTVALMDRGLVEYNRELTRENGYETHTLTARGLWVKGYLEGNPDAREFLTSMVDAAVRKVGSDTGDKRTETMTKTQPAPEPTEPVRYCGERETQTGYDYTCTLSGPHDTHKAQGMNDQTVYEWPTVIEYSVKIWYRSGAYEGVTHSPEDLAREIFADAVESDGVQFAELHGPSGKLVESKVPVPSEPLSCGRLSCGRVFAEDSSRACVRVRGHYGLHRDRINASSSRVVSWGDNECRTA